MRDVSSALQRNEMLLALGALCCARLTKDGDRSYAAWFRPIKTPYALCNNFELLAGFSEAAH